MQERDAKGPDSSTKEGHLIVARKGFFDHAAQTTGPIMSDGKRMPGTQPDDAESLVVSFQSSQSGVRVGDTNATLDSNNGSRRQNGVIVPADPVAYRTSGNCGVMEQGDKTAALNTATDPNQNIVGVGIDGSEVGFALRSNASHSGDKGDGGVNTTMAVSSGYGCRRLLPIECERLQGFSDGWTEFGMDESGNLIPQSDSARYRQLGNAVTVSVSRWIARRLRDWLQQQP